MNPYHNNIEDITLSNSDFRKVLYTGNHTQLVLMNLRPGEDIGLETHDNVDQFFRIEAGEGVAMVDKKEIYLKDGVALIVPAGSEHNITNTSEVDDLKMYTLYSPANHPDGTVHKTKAEADEYEKSHH